ncbi:MAG: LTA synthase family protein, partial [Bacteroidales bacterium]
AELIKFLKATFLYGIFWLGFFFFARLIFLLYQFRELIQYTPAEIIQTYFYGLKFDLSVTGYLLILPLLTAIPYFFIRGRWYLKFLKSYSAVLLFLFTALVIGDAVVYSFWGYRVDFSVVEYLKYPKDAFASATTFQLLAGIIVYAVIVIIMIIIINRLINKIYSFPPKKALLVQSLLLLLLTGLLIVPIRGGLGVAPLNTSSAYFSEHIFLNHSALNVAWHFGHTAVYYKPLTNPYHFSSREEALENFHRLMIDNGTTINALNTNKPNILLFILESFGSEIINSHEGDLAIAPRFTQYISEGIYFSNFYAAGSRTDKAIPAIFSGYPNLPAIQVIREPRKTESLSGIFKILDSTGYKTSFWYGGDINFANINSFITSTGFREKVTMDNFNRKDRNSKWGVHDHIVFERLFDSLLTTREPFGYAVLSLSSHEPFEVPMKTVVKGNDVLSRFKNSVYYTDKSLGEFLDRAVKTEWWKRTLIIIIADHCRRNSETIPAYSESIFRVPMLWLGGALEIKDTVISKPCSQFDLPATLISQLGLKRNFPFSKNILSTGSAPFAFYTYNEGFVFITDSSKAVYDLPLKRFLAEEGNSTIAEKYGKSFLQVLFDDYLSR